MFTDHTIESAPPAARRAMTAVVEQLGYLPTPVARMAESPALLDGFRKLSGLFETTTLDPLARETLIMTVATRNGCHVCVAMHTAKLTALGAAPELISALRGGGPIPAPRLAAVREFTVEVLASAGAVPEDRLTAFLAHGFTRRQALEVVLGIGAYTLSTVANRLTDAPLDEQLAAYA
ncbi:carboxymuconolactone decarboxylase family protein [Actinophytocola gossypii]|uniref:Carboxymuconolactone decarboxylase family protein n=1 Tax=Actinophytocola gossypii TaxID=2812003 RepID=A0ABT2J7J6_9PSEU|nr:carboxymuconolactone decarboxylase family protein [Actinophytocola gossypii]MCT2583812.1 carboxymuconolactone decarboxylase family protein [Actinophytocola gossypii]